VSGFLSRSTVMVRRERKHRGQEPRVHDTDIRPLVHDLAVLSDDRVTLTLVTGDKGSVKPTEVLGAALSLSASSVPLIQIHKLVARCASGDTPLAQALARVEVNTLETRDIDCWEPARNARGDPGG
jgi:hypothetical protein